SIRFNSYIDMFSFTIVCLTTIPFDTNVFNTIYIVDKLIDLSTFLLSKKISSAVRGSFACFNISNIIFLCFVFLIPWLLKNSLLSVILSTLSISFQAILYFRKIKSIQPQFIYKEKYPKVNSIYNYNSCSCWEI